MKLISLQGFTPLKCEGTDLGIGANALKQHVEFRSFCLFQKFPVFKSCEPSVASGLTVVSREVMAQLLVYTLIK